MKWISSKDDSDFPKDGSFFLWLELLRDGTFKERGAEWDGWRFCTHNIDCNADYHICGLCSKACWVYEPEAKEKFSKWLRLPRP